MNGERSYHVATSRPRKATEGRGYVLSCTCGHPATGRTATGAQRAFSFHVAQAVSEAMR